MGHSILAFSHQATRAYRYFTKEDFLFMMSDMTVQEIADDLQRFKQLEEYEICKKVEYVLQVKKQTESIAIHSLIREESLEK